MDFSSTKACSLPYFLLPYFFYLHRLTLIVLLQQYVSHTTRADVKVYCVWVPSSIASTFQGPDIIFIYYSIITHLIGCATRINFLLEFHSLRLIKLGPNHQKLGHNGFALKTPPPQTSLYLRKGVFVGNNSM